MFKVVIQGSEYCPFFCLAFDRTLILAIGTAFITSNQIAECQAALPRLYSLRYQVLVIEVQVLQIQVLQVRVLGRPGLIT